MKAKTMTDPSAAFVTFVCVMRLPPSDKADLQAVLNRIAKRRNEPLHRIYLQALKQFIAADTATNESTCQ